MHLYKEFLLDGLFSNREYNNFRDRSNSSHKYLNTDSCFDPGTAMDSSWDKHKSEDSLHIPWNADGKPTSESRHEGKVFDYYDPVHT